MKPRESASGSEDARFAALADPIRRRILVLLAERDRTVGEIAGHFPLSRPAISKHLRVLRASGLVREFPDGRRRIQAFQSAALRPLSAWIRDREETGMNRRSASSGTD